MRPSPARERAAAPAGLRGGSPALPGPHAPGSTDPGVRLSAPSSPLPPGPRSKGELEEMVSSGQPLPEDLAQMVERREKGTRVSALLRAGEPAEALQVRRCCALCAPACVCVCVCVCLVWG